MKRWRNKLGAATIAICLTTASHGGEPIGTSDGDSEFGEIEEVTYRKSNWEPWKITLSGDVHYFDDIRSIDVLAPTLAGFIQDEDDVVFRTGLSVQYTPLITGNLFLDTSITQDFYRFNELDRLDFDYFSGDLGLIYVLQDLRDLQLFARYRYERLAEATFGSRFYSNHSIEAGAQQVYRFAPGQAVFGAVKAQLSLDTSPDISEYDEYSLNLGYQWEHEPFEVTLLYRLAYSDFDGLDRSDYNHLVMLRGEYHWTDWLTLAADVSFSSNDSDVEAFDYDTFGVGAGVSFQVTF